MPPKLDIEQVKAILAASDLIASWQVLLPHPIHGESGEVKESSLIGDPVQDLHQILNRLRSLLAKPSI